MIAIAIEGLDCSGKTTLVNKVKEKIEAQCGDKVKVIIVGNPGSGVFGDKLREIILSDTPKPPSFDLALLFANRLALADILKQHQDEGNTIILVDRWDISAFVYQKSDSMMRKLYNSILPAYHEEHGIKDVRATLVLDIDKDTFKERWMKRHQEEVSSDQFEPSQVEEIDEWYDKYHHDYIEGVKAYFGVPELKISDINQLDPTAISLYTELNHPYLERDGLLLQSCLFGGLDNSADIISSWLLEEMSIGHKDSDTDTLDTTTV